MYVHISDGGVNEIIIKTSPGFEIQPSGRSNTSSVTPPTEAAKFPVSYGLLECLNKIQPPTNPSTSYSFNLQLGGIIHSSLHCSKISLTPNFIALNFTIEI